MRRRGAACRGREQQGRVGVSECVKLHSANTRPCHRVAPCLRERVGPDPKHRLVAVSAEVHDDDVRAAVFAQQVHGREVDRATATRGLGHSDGDGAGVEITSRQVSRAASPRRRGGTWARRAHDSEYNHVGNKDDLLDGMLDRVAAEIELPDSTHGWRDGTRRRAVAAHAAMMRHPWAATLWTASITLRPARMRYLDRALRCLREAGLTSDLLDRAFHPIENHIFGHALQAQGFPLDQNQMQETGELLMDSFPVTDYPDLAAHIRHHLQLRDGGDGFEFGLDLILDGLQRLRGAS